MTRLVDVFLRVLLIALFGACVAVQVCAGPLAAALVGGVSGVVLICLIVAGALCVEAVLTSVWMLAGMVSDESIFDGRTRADRWTNAAITALGLAAVFAAGGFAARRHLRGARLPARRHPQLCPRRMTDLALVGGAVRTADLVVNSGVMQ